MLIFNEQTNTYTTDRPETHKVMISGAEKYIGNAFSSMTALPDIPVIEVAVEELTPYRREEYEAKVAELIRGRYTLDEELAIMRKMKALELSPALMTADDGGDGSERADAVESEFLAYNDFAEECKAKAKELLSSCSRDT